MERVFVVDREDLFGKKTPHGMILLHEAGIDGENWLAAIETRGYFTQRAETEKDPGKKQIIPYCIVTAGDKILLLRRLRGGGEVRLHSLLSIGVGGHINPVDTDADTRNILMKGARRELNEEIEISDDHELEVIGFVNDDTNSVGSVHFGVVLRTHLKPDTRIKIKEYDQLEGRLEHIATLKEILKEDPSSFETWSRLVLDKLDLTVVTEGWSPFSPA